MGPPTISIHALLAESDDVACGYWYQLPHFYPRSPCGERRMECLSTSTRRKFLSTLSLRRATICKPAVNQIALFLSTLSLRRATLPGGHFVDLGQFLSTLSLRRATPVIHCLYTAICISIHALLAESDREYCSNT
mgnify:CR=1 FL=1